jgi:hypothetical protein
MRLFRAKTLLATSASVILPLLALAYIASLPDRKSTAAILIQIALVVGGLIFFGLMLSKLLEQMNAGRVARWLETIEGREWLDSLPEEEREAFVSRIEGFK